MATVKREGQLTFETKNITDDELLSACADHEEAVQRRAQHAAEQKTINEISKQTRDAADRINDALTNHYGKGDDDLPAIDKPTKIFVNESLVLEVRPKHYPKRTRAAKRGIKVKVRQYGPDDNDSQTTT